MRIDKAKTYLTNPKKISQQTLSLHNNIWKKTLDILGGLLPKGLYVRALLIIITPIVLLIFVLTFVFMERHWESVTKRLSTATSRDVSMLVALYDTLPPNTESKQKIIRLGRDKLDLNVQFLPHDDLPPRQPKPFFGLIDKALSRGLGHRIDYPFWLDTIGDSNFVEIRIQLKSSILRVLARRSQTFASNSHIFLVWMVSTSLILLTVAILFLRNQIRPILRLADAAKSFGMGRPVAEDFRPRGAREVREAAIAFLDMRDRIERHVEQRTTMLAGVSHDLRTILTRFKLQLAILGNAPEIEAMNADIREMQDMLEDYMAFSRGDNNEETSETEINALLKEVCSNSELIGASIDLTPLPQPASIPLRRNAFKRALMNLITNAIRYGQKISITPKLNTQWLYISIEDDGPGIPPDKYEEVFRPFYRLDNDARNQDEGNTGLGLSIASDITHAHGGNIILDKSKMGGLKATIKIPF
ncbi:MAG: ATP-binding protein [Pseudomonadota bacterium]